MSLWDDFNEAIDKKETIIILVSIFVATLATALTPEFKIFNFQNLIISTIFNTLILVVVCFVLAILSFFILFEFIPSILTFISDLIKEKVEKHGISKIVLILLIIYIFLSKLKIIPF